MTFCLDLLSAEDFSVAFLDFKFIFISISSCSKFLAFGVGLESILAEEFIDGGLL